MLSLLVALTLGGTALHGPALTLGSAGNTTPQPSGKLDWSLSGATAWAGLPAPTLACTAAPAGGTMTCTGATATPYGSPTTSGSPYHPDGVWTSETDVPSVVFSGAQYVDLGTFDFSTCAHMVACINFYNASVSGSSPQYELIFNEDDGGAGGHRVMLIDRDTTTVYGYMYKTNSSNSVVSSTNLTSAWNTYCLSYNRDGGDGASVMRGNLNGAAGSVATNAPSPMQQGTIPLRIGANGAASPYYYFTGRVSNAAIWCSATVPTGASALATAVASMQSLLTSKPSSGAVTFTRNDTQLCCPVSDASCYWTATNTPCVTSAGTALFGASSNLALQSQTIATSPWAATHGGGAASDPSPTNNQAAAPDGTNTATLVSFPAIAGAGQYSYLYLPITTAAGTYAVSFWARTVSGTGTLWSQGTLGQGVSTALTTTWKRVVQSGTSVTGTFYIVLGPDQQNDASQQPTTQPALSVYLWGVQLEPGSSPTPYHATAGTAYSGPATVASEAVTLTSNATACIGFRGTTADITATRTFLSLGTLNAANTASITESGATLTLAVKDNASGDKHVSATLAAPLSNAQVIGCTVGGVLTMWVNGTPYSTQVGAGTGLLASLPGTLYVATDVTANGYIAKTCQGNSFRAVSKCLH